MVDFTNPGGFLDPFDGFDKPDISQGSTASHKWRVYRAGTEVASGIETSLAAAQAAVKTAGGSADYTWDIYTIAGVFVEMGEYPPKTGGTSFGDSGDGTYQGQGQGEGLSTDLGGEPYTDESLIDAMHMVLILPDKWASGYIFDGLTAAKAGLEAQRGSLPAGQSYKYEIWDRAKVVVSGTVSSAAYVPDDIHYFYQIRDLEANVDIVLESVSPAYTTLSEAKTAAIAFIGTERTKKPDYGTYDWAIYKAGQVVERGTVFWPSDRGDWKGGSTTPPTPPLTPPGSIFDGIPQEAVMAVIAVIVIVAIIAVVMSVGGI
jgi:hypothetical protein